MRTKRPATSADADTALLDWLATFAYSLEYDDAVNEWTVRCLHGYATARGPTLRVAAERAKAAAQALDARPTVRLAR